MVEWNWNSVQGFGYIVLVFIGTVMDLCFILDGALTFRVLNSLGLRFKVHERDSLQLGRLGGDKTLSPRDTILQSCL